MLCRPRAPYASTVRHPRIARFLNQRRAQESEDVTAPLPHLGVSFNYGITPSVALRLQTIGFAVEIDNIDGSIIEVDADVLWHPWEHVGFGAGVRYFEVKVKAEDSGFNGEYEFNYLGPVVYAAVSF